MPRTNAFGARASMGAGLPDFYRLDAVPTSGLALGVDLGRSPVTLKILLENAVRHAGGGIVREDDVAALASWRPGGAGEAEIPFMPARVVLQDFTGVPAVVDLAAMRDAMADLGGDPAKVNPLVPADLVIDHSVQIDAWGGAGAFAINVEREYERNGERYQLLRWAQTAFRDLRVVPPGTGIIHQVNLEYLATVVTDREDADGRVAYPDTLVGTDSHTTMVNGLGVLGYGVGGIEAEAVLLGQPLYQPMPRIVGVRLTGELPTASTATDLVLVDHRDAALVRRGGLVRRVRRRGPRGPGAGRPGHDLEHEPRVRRDGDAVPDRRRDAVVPAAHRPHAGARRPGRALRQGPGPVARAGQRARVRRRARAGPGDASSRRWPVRGGPRTGSRWRPSARASATAFPQTEGIAARPIPGAGDAPPFGHGSVAIAAITSCTNTSNPTVMVGAGLLARNAVARGLHVSPTVKTSLAPGSKAVTGYLEKADLMRPLAALGFSLAGYGCTTCIGNSGPLAEPVATAIESDELIVAAVLSGNRNFEGRIHPLVRASYLASPPLVVAFALAGRVDVDLTTEPLGIGDDGRPVMLTDIWPSPAEVREVIAGSIDPELFRETYASVFEGDERWTALPIPSGDRYAWDPDSTYIARPPFFEGLTAEPAPLTDIDGARVLASSAIRSRRTTSARPGRSPPGRPPASGSRRTASGRSSSTRTAPAAATTR